MPDMLVRLYNLPELDPVVRELKERQGIIIKRPLCMDRPMVVEWVQTHFGQSWAEQTQKAFTNTPISCFIAIKDETLIGFGCYDSTYRNFFGPTGLLESQRGKGAGKGLLLACMHAMAWDGYGYAIIGGVGPVEFYRKTVGAEIIENSEPGIYRDRLPEKI